MKKTFFEYNFHRKELHDKFINRQEEIEGIDVKYEYLQHLLYTSGKSYYIPQNIDFEELVSSLELWLKDEQKLETESFEIKNIKVIKTSPSSKVAKFLGLSKSTALIFIKNETYLSYFFIPPDWFDKPVINEELEKPRFLSNLFNDNIEKYIFDYIKKNNPNKNLSDYASPENYFVDNLTPKYQQFFLSERQENEVLLAWLEISSLKKLALNKDFSKNTNWFYVLTNFDSMLIGFNKNGDVVDAFELQNRSMEVRKSIRTTVVVDTYEWNSTMTNSSLFKQIAPCLALDSEMRIKEVAKLNVSIEQNYDFAKFLLSQLDNIIAPLTIFIINYVTDKEKTTDEYSQNEKLNNILLNILNSSQAEELLVFWHKDWNFNVEQSAFLVKILIEASENTQHLKEILPFHTQIHQLLISKEKNIYNKILFDIEYCRHLIVLEKFKEAEKILSKNLKKLPDQTIADLLPSIDIDPTGQLSGQFLKVLLLELLSETQKNSIADKTIREIAIRQPLAKNRVYNLAGINNVDIKNKANIILKILDGTGLEPNEAENKIKYNPITSKEIELLKHESLRKNGILNSFSKWVSSQNVTDFSQLKKYADRLTPKNYKQIADIVADLLHFFNFQNVEVYIAHGEYSVGIRAFEAEIPFIIIGNEHFNLESPFFMTYNELKFSIASELAYVYFKFARITSTDIWRGAMNKSDFVVDTVFTLIPFVGGMKSLVKSASKIKGLSTFFSNNEKVSRILIKSQQIALTTEKSAGILGIASQMLETIGSITTKGDAAKKEELIAVSRMMQITAERIGLLVCNDPISATRSLFLTSKNIVENLPYVQKYGINNFLLKKDEKGDFYNQNFAVRFAAMFSFYFSEDYDNIQEKIVANNETE